MIPSNQILTRSASFVPLDKMWRMVDSLYGGTETMRDAGQEYLPKAPKETNNDYAARLQSSVLSNFYKQAVTTTNDLVFNNGISVENTTPAVDQFFDDVNAKGDNLETFMRDTTKSAIHYGVSYIVCDYSRPANQEPSIYDRPYWSLVEAPNMIAIESQMIRGVETITHIRFQETTTRSYNNAGSMSGQAATLNFGSTLVSQVRAYWLDVSNPDQPIVMFQIYQRPDGEQWVMVNEGTQEGVSRIPFVPVYGNKTGYYIGRSLYADVAELNVRHWQSYSDQSNLLHYARFPILMATGIEDRDSNGKPVEIEIGANTVLKTSNPDADLKFVEHTGKAVDAGWNDIDRLEDLMTIFGPSLAVNAGGNGSTATEWVLRASSLNSTLKALSESTENSLNHIMAFTIPYLNEAQMPDFEIDPRVLNIPEPKNDAAKADTTGTQADPAMNTVNTVTNQGSQTLANAAAASDN